MWTNFILVRLSMHVKSYSVSTARIERDDINFKVQEGKWNEGRKNKSTQNK